MARTKQTARKSSSFKSWPYNNTSNTTTTSLPNLWNKIYKEQNNDEFSSQNFGCMQRGSSTRYSFHEQSQPQTIDPSIHLKSSFNTINTVSPLPKSTWPTNITTTIPSKPPPKKKPIKRKSTRSKSKKSNNNAVSSIGNYTTNTMNLGKRQKRTSYNRNYSTYKRRRSSKQSIKVMKEIKKYQTYTKLLLPKASFCRLVREIASEYKADLRFSTVALEALQQATEWYITRVLKDANLCALHTQRIKIELKDIQLARRLRAHKEKQYTF